jgi:error-prone DNA polymerase
LAVTDRHTLAGAVRMHCAAKHADLKLLIGSEIIPEDAPPILLYATNRASYGRLSRLITRGCLRMPKGQCAIRFDDVAEFQEGLIGVVLPPVGHHVRHTHEETTRFTDQLNRYRDVFGDRLYVAAEMHAGADDATRLTAVAESSRRTGVPMAAANDVHYHVPQRRFLQDVLTCIREQCTITNAGKRLFPNGERYLKSPEQMARLFAAHPDAVARTIEIADRCTFSLDELRYEYPEELCPPDQTPARYLAELTWQGARRHFPGGVPPKVRRLLEHELELIEELAYEPYFLTVWDLVRFARSRDILCQGRGSAANSAVCYVLDVTNVDPDRIDVLFERFVSKERNEPPDIDVDFEHERREEVFEYIYDKYGRERAGIVAEVITYRPRSAVRDVGKALGLSLDRVDLLAKKLEWWGDSPLPENAIVESGLDPDDRTVRILGRLIQQIVGFPRHLSQHVGGFVITKHPLCELVPIENAAMPNRTFIEWDKDDIDALGILKVDCLALGMLTAISKCLELLRRHEGTKARRYEGEKKQDEGTKGRRDGGKRDEGTKGRRDIGVPTRGLNDRESLLGDCDGGEEDVSGSGCLAEERGVGESDLSDDATDAGIGAVRADTADAQSGGIDSLQHCRGERPANAPRLPPISQHRKGLTRRVGDPGHHRKPAQHVPQKRAINGAPQRSRPCPSGSHQESSNEKFPPSPTINASHAPPSSLCPFVPSSLSSPPSCLSSIPPEDPTVYAMIRRADTIGVFQIESRAQMSMLPRLRPRCFYDLVIEVAIVRPGPIQGGMVHPYLRRRNGEEPVTFPNKAIEEVLRKTLGVPLFQEQAMRLAVVAGGFTPGEADQLRRAMGAWRRHGAIDRFRTKLIEGMLANGLSREFAKRCFEQISGFGEYGFPESHAASFALLVYVSAWLKRYHPAAFTASLLNSQPMGFYAPAQLARDAREHGVEVRPVDVNESGWDCRLEHRGDRTKKQREQAEEERESWGLNGPALRLGMRLLKGLSQEKAMRIEAARRDGPFKSVHDLVRRSGAGRGLVARLAAADAFRSMGLNRREAVWQALTAVDEEMPLFNTQEPQEERPALPEISLAERVVSDYDRVGLSLEAHPVSLVRDELNHMRINLAKSLKKMKHGTPVQVAGLVLVRQRPSTAGGIVFMTLEDETGVANLIVRPRVYNRCRRAARNAVALIADGRLERQGDVIHVQVSHLREMGDALSTVRIHARNFH